MHGLAKLMRGVTKHRGAWRQPDRFPFTGNRSYERCVPGTASLLSRRARFCCKAMGQNITGNGFEDRVVGSFLGALCGDVLGASVEGWTPERIAGKYKKGLTEFQKTERG